MVELQLRRRRRRKLELSRLSLGLAARCLNSPRPKTSESRARSGVLGSCPVVAATTGSWQHCSGRRRGRFSAGSLFSLLVAHVSRCTTPPRDASGLLSARTLSSSLRLHPFQLSAPPSRSRLVCLSPTQILCPFQHHSRIAWQPVNYEALGQSAFNPPKGTLHKFHRGRHDVQPQCESQFPQAL